MSPSPGNETPALGKIRRQLWNRKPEPAVWSSYLWGWGRSGLGRSRSWSTRCTGWASTPPWPQRLLLRHGSSGSWLLLSEWSQQWTKDACLGVIKGGKPWSEKEDKNGRLTKEAGRPAMRCARAEMLPIPIATMFVSLFSQSSMSTNILISHTIKSPWNSLMGHVQHWVAIIETSSRSHKSL